MLFAILSSRGESINTDEVKNIMVLIRFLSPQKDIFQFTKPGYAVYEKVMNSVHENSEELFKDRVQKALKAFEY